MNILILGAAGRTGTLLVNQAVAAGHTVTAFIHKETNSLSNIKNVHVIVGDARNVTELEKALHGQDVVISTLGSSKPSDQVINKSIESLITASKTARVKRVIQMSSFLVSNNFRPNPVIKFVLKLMGGIVSDFQTGEERLRSSDLEYTIVYATRLTNDPLNPHYIVIDNADSVGPNQSISRTDVAEFLLKQVSDKTYVGKSVLITNK
jgi:uncharacterized protein YbjT (DUF2867 family)